jgi:hypothetical protein
LCARTCLFDPIKGIKANFFKSLTERGASTLANLITKSEYDRIKKQFFIVWVFEASTGEYVSHVTNVSIIKAVDLQMDAFMKGNVAFVYPMVYHHRMPVIPSDSKFNVNTLEFKAKVLPLLMEDRDSPLTWEEVEAFMQGE